MKRDSIFYRLFQQSPSLLFDLLENPPDNATEYRFDSVAVKEPKFEIDGVFLPPDNDSSGVIYFCEVQFQKDERLYERVFGESFLYFYRQRERFTDWQIVVIYPTRSLEQSNTHPYRALLNCPQVHRIYLNELGEIQQFLLQRRFGAVDEVLAARIQSLEIEQLESLAEALLDFTALNDLVLWLNRYSL